jgi:hypothetical protein
VSVEAVATASTATARRFFGLPPARQRMNQERGSE